MNYNFSIWYIVYCLFLIITFSILNSVSFVFSNFVFVKRSNSCFTSKAFNNKCPSNSNFNFLITTFSDQFGMWPWAKMFLHFDFLARSPSLNLGFYHSFLISLLKSIYVLDFTSLHLILVVWWYVLLYSLTILANYQFTHILRSKSYLNSFSSLRF